MEKDMLGTQIVTQVGILVRDIEKASQDFADFLGVDKPGWSWTGTFEEAQTEYLGQPSTARSKLAFFHVGPTIDIELIEPDEQHSTWRDDLEKYGEGVHHLAFNIQGMKQAILKLGKNGMPLLQKGEYPGGRYAYIDANETLKCVIELLENDK